MHSKQDWQFKMLTAITLIKFNILILIYSKLNLSLQDEWSDYPF